MPKIRCSCCTKECLIHYAPKCLWQHLRSLCIPFTQEGRQGWIFRETNYHTWYHRITLWMLIKTSGALMSRESSMWPIVNDNQGFRYFVVRRKFYVAYIIDSALELRLSCTNQPIDVSWCWNLLHHFGGGFRDRLMVGYDTPVTYWIGDSWSVIRISEMVIYGLVV